MAFKKGDLVRLKSGGPTMSVEDTGARHMTGEPAVWCTWFERVGGRQKVQRETFSPEVLEIATQDASVSFARFERS